MDNEVQLERFRRVLTELADEEVAEARLIAGPHDPLSPTLHAQLLRISMAKPAAPARWYKEPLKWLAEHRSKRVWVPLLLVPAAAIALIVPVALHHPPAAAPRPLSAYKKEVLLTEPAQSADRRLVLGSHEPQRPAAQELKAKRHHTLSIVLSPLHAEGGPVAVRSFLRRDGHVQEWMVSPVAQPDGSFLLHRSVRTLPDLQADQELLIAVGRPEAMPTSEDLRRGKRPEPGRWELGVWHLLIED